MAAVEATTDLCAQAEVIHGDCLDMLRTLPDASVDAVVTDPPAGIAFMGKDWDAFRRARNPADVGRESVFGRTSRTAPHSYGESDRGYFIATMTAIFAEALRVTKPGGHALVWALPRTSHWTATALEDAGWEIREKITHNFGTGFPKSLDPMKAAQKSGIVCQCQTGVIQYPDTLSKGEVPHGDLSSLRETTAEDATEPTHEVLLDSVRGQSETHAAGCEDVRGVRHGVATPDAVSSRTQQDLRAGMQRQAYQPGDDGRDARSASQGGLPTVWGDVSHPERAHVGTVLQSVMPGQGECRSSDAIQRQHEGTQTGRSAIRPGQSSLEGRSDAEADPRQLPGRAIRPVSSRVSGNGARRRLRDGASARDGAGVGALPDASGSRTPHRPQSSEQQPGQSPAIPEQSGAQTCGSCGLPIWPYKPGELGTALKPASEDWILCRRPLAEPTVAAQVLATGTGAINVDACRIPSPGKTPFPGAGYGRHVTDSTFQFAGDPRFKTTGRDARPGERWPPNLLYSHLPECDETACAEGCAVAELDRQSGYSQTPARVTRGSRRSGIAGLGGLGRQEMMPCHGDAGGASRFFPVFRYQAKASRAERNAGCEGLSQTTTLGPMAGRGQPGLKCRACGRWKVSGNPCDCAEPDWEQSAFERPATSNGHPTVKSVSLMRWLVRLITPPGGLVLDPFAGSGTTGVAAVGEGMRFVGIERETEYVAIARARIAAAMEGAQG